MHKYNDITRYYLIAMYCYGVLQLSDTPGCVCVVARPGSEQQSTGIKNDSFLCTCYFKTALYTRMYPRCFALGKHNHVSQMIIAHADIRVYIYICVCLCACVSKSYFYLEMGLLISESYLYSELGLRYKGVTRTRSLAQATTARRHEYQHREAMP